jgi:hypothetical protein
MMRSVQEVSTQLQIASGLAEQSTSHEWSRVTASRQLTLVGSARADNSKWCLSFGCISPRSS